MQALFCVSAENVAFPRNSSAFSVFRRMLWLFITEHEFYTLGCLQSKLHDTFECTFCFLTIAQCRDLTRDTRISRCRNDYHNLRTETDKYDVCVHKRLSRRVIKGVQCICTCCTRSLQSLFTCSRWSAFVLRISTLASVLPRTTKYLIQ